MKKSKFGEEQIVRILKEVEGIRRSLRRTASMASASRRATSGRSKYAGMEVSQLRHLKDVEAELVLCVMTRKDSSRYEAPHRIILVKAAGPSTLYAHRQRQLSRICPCTPLWRSFPSSAGCSFSDRPV